ncbi:MAG: sugar transferase [Chloroflexota bacterium]
MAATYPSQAARRSPTPFFSWAKKVLNRFLKRFLDIVLSILGLAGLSPLFVVISILIKRESTGPVFYAGQRLGRNGRRLNIWKFRTMYENAESYQGPAVTANGDRRVTPFGRWLRQTKINELPQLYNVLKGDMSLVGPRPEDPAIVATWPEDVRSIILSMRPGITSPASILYRDEEQMLQVGRVMDDYLRKILPDKLRLDQLYVRNHTFLTDLDVILWTLMALAPLWRQTAIPETLLYAGPLYNFARRYLNWFILDCLVAFLSVTISGVLWRTGGPLHVGVDMAFAMAVMMAIVFSLSNSVLGLGRVSWRHARSSFAIDLAFSNILATIGLILVNRYWPWGRRLLPFGLVMVSGLLTYLGALALRYRERLVTGLASRWLWYRRRASIFGERVLIVGAGECGQLAAWLLQKSSFASAFAIIGMIDDDPYKQGLLIEDYPVMGTTRDLTHVAARKDIGLILFAITNISSAEQERILQICHQTAARVVIIPDLLQILQDHLSPNSKAGLSPETGSARLNGACAEIKRKVVN